ncbi:MAG TPA: hypothetical protein VHC92_13060 [Rhodanobacteraceae bacterium]|nr:hypothetical protein [Rhodanobacteraceae bacterium]
MQTKTEADDTNSIRRRRISITETEHRDYAAIVRPRDAFAITGESASSYDRGVRNGTHVPFFPIGARRVGAFYGELIEGNRARAAGLSEDALRALVRELLARRALYAPKAAA